MGKNEMNRVYIAYTSRHAHNTHTTRLSHLLTSHHRHHNRQFHKRVEMKVKLKYCSYEFIDIFAGIM